MLTAAAHAPKPYLYAGELAGLTPWSVEAIHKKVQRGELKRGVHYFQEGHRGRLIFKWAAIVAVIENGNRDEAAATSERRSTRKVLDVAKATTELRRLLG